MRTLLCAVVMLAACGVAYGEGMNVSALTPEAADAVEVRVGFDVGNQWEVGGLAAWFIEEPSSVWGVGGYVKFYTDPEASIPVSQWLGALGRWMGLPETMAGKTFGIAKLTLADHTEDPVMVASVGPGVEIGPLVAEFVYQFVDGGVADTGGGGPELRSGPVLWLGARFEF